MQTHERVLLYISYALVLIAIALSAGLGVALHRSIERDKAALTAICGWAWDSGNFNDQALCGRLQGATKAEYLCNKDKCWIELK